jgi:predicted nucleic acid-binding protein
MKYVLDSSLAFKWIVPEALSDKAILLRDEFRQGLHEFLAPDVFPVQVGHALTRAERQGRVSTADGFALWTEVMVDYPQLFSSSNARSCIFWGGDSPVACRPSWRR